MSAVARLRGRDVSITRRLNGWGAARSTKRFFAVVSRLGDGVAWYGLILVLPLVDGRRGLVAAALGSPANAVVLYTARPTRWFSSAFGDEAG